MIYSNSKEDYNGCFITQLMLNHNYARFIGTIPQAYHMTGCNNDSHLVSRSNRKLSTSHTEENRAFVWFQVNLRKENMFILLLPVVFLENVLIKKSSDNNFSSCFMTGSCNLPCSYFFFLS